MRPTLRSLAALLTLLLLAAPTVAHAEAEKVLGMNIEGDKLSDKDRADLFAVLSSKLGKYPDATLVKPPERELTEEMIDLECFDIDLSCLARLGIKYGADKVFYIQVDPQKAGGYEMLVRIVDANEGRLMRDRTLPIAAAKDLAATVELEIEAVLGKPPVDGVAKMGKLIIEANLPNAEIFVGKAPVGQGKVELDKPAGDYVIRVTHPGYDEAIVSAAVKAGETTQTPIALTPTLVTKKPGAGEVDDDDDGWIVWAVVGAVLVGGAVALVAVLVDEDDAARGPAVFSIDGGNAWRDPTTLGGRP